MSFTKNIQRSALMSVVAASLMACDSAMLFDTAQPTLGAALGETSANLLGNGGFESPISVNDWESCAPGTDFSTDATPSDGLAALSVSNGSCLSQTVPAVAGATYTLSCEAYEPVDRYSTITFGFIDDSSAPVEVQEIAIDGSSYGAVSSTLTAPASADRAQVLIFSDGEAVVDNCSLIKLADAVLLNGDFSEDLSGWQVCENTAGTVSVIDHQLEPGNKQLSISNGGCVYQTLDVSAPMQVRSDLHLYLSCDALTSDDGYSSITLGYLDGNSQPLSVNEVAISRGSTNGLFESDLAAPAGSHFAEVVIYSDAFTTADNCQITH